ncbi:hypothetical protein AYY17_17530 [Morganella psychrotolerans]|uniref:Uncharacterized protein n=2 Tax=Morganella psychrotolerans TaxID=368603 RepID=A0A1B8HKV7_9GAMM|nr:hypothetical protein AYY17_17530 [Morganella psychrotolerans]
MPYTLSKRKSKINIFIAETAGENAENIPQSLRSAHKICVIKDDNKNTRTYHRIETFYPGYTQRHSNCRQAAREISRGA